MIWLWNELCQWLVKDRPAPSVALTDFPRLCQAIRPGDVLLLEGRSRISDVIKMITQSSWTHSALCIGCLADMPEGVLKQKVQAFYQGDEKEPLIIEALLGEGTLVSPLNKYHQDHLRICRPTGICDSDAQRVVRYVTQQIGMDYDVRQLLDLARFFFPWSILPRRWRSSLFLHNAGAPTRTVCSCLIAHAFNRVDFPILPFIHRQKDGTVRFFKRNPRLFVPKDFDYSPYFRIIKYPSLGLDDLGVYRELNWGDEAIVYNDESEFNPHLTIQKDVTWRWPKWPFKSPLLAMNLSYIKEENEHVD